MCFASEIGYKFAVDLRDQPKLSLIVKCALNEMLLLAS